MTAAHRDPRLLLLVAAGGTVGTLLRWAASEVVPAAGAFPLATLAVNLAGSFVLGFLLEELLRRGAETPALRRWRLGLGTGVCGGLTTWSSFAVELERLLSGGSAGTALGYAAASLAGGLLAVAAGVALAARRAR
ncbi:fluoride efflux transporter FluC [Kineococcus rhizosphaerae]|uniref:Fluoride-specific ion channel FluC n=1 Tax=Kineococcus rhizosphaerae TaxID=559628 RepID=A0A2T0R2Z0_9ACTN|nr:CrcB family protein [Kineococcus rhizosphaerae]PRY14150.1 CrcB protein [Kineococcus rhizosphaerae]